MDERFEAKLLELWEILGCPGYYPEIKLPDEVFDSVRGERVNSNAVVVSGFLVTRNTGLVSAHVEIQETVDV